MKDHIDERRKFASLLTALSDYYRQEISKAVAGLYWEGLKQYDYEAIEKAAWAHTQNPDESGRWFPKIADLRKLLEGSTVDQAAIAWSKVDTAIRTRGTWDDVVFDDALIHRVIADLGGWVWLGTKTEGDKGEWPFVARDFQTRYRHFALRGITDYPAKLTGIANAHNGAQGQPLLPPILLGDTAKAKAVLKGASAAQMLGNQPANPPQLGHE
jgi:hypothetical protein